MENKIKDKKLSVVMPVFNEEGIIEKSVREVHKEVLSRFKDWEFVLVNDSSTDSTPKILERLKNELGLTLLNNKKNLGHGPALIRGYKAITGQLVFQMDSDYQTAPRDFWKLYEKIEKNDLVLGCRVKRKDPLYRRMITGAVRVLSFLIFGAGVRDANTPFRLMKREMLMEFLRIVPEDLLVPSIALSIFSKRKGFKVREVEVEHLERAAGRSSIMRFKLLAFCFKAFGQLLSLRGKLVSRGAKT